MASFTDQVIEVNVGETEIGEVYVGEVNVGTLTREADFEIEPEDFLEACDSQEKIQLLDLLFNDEELFYDWIQRMPPADMKDVVSEIIKSASDRDVQLKDILPENIEQAAEEQTEQMNEEIRRSTQEQLENIAERPPLDFIRDIKLIQNIEPAQLRAFPREVISVLCDKLIGASDPMVVYQIPPDLKTMIEGMQAGEVSEGFVNELKAQIG